MVEIYMPDLVGRRGEVPDHHADLLGPPVFDRIALRQLR
jgi:hypothetical protein